MASNCLDTKLLAYSGTSQQQRALDALLAKAAQVDERTTADLILFTKRYSAYLNYYDLTNAITGDWQGLMGNDVAVAIASVADWNTKDYAPFIKNLTDTIINIDASDVDAQNHFKIFFDFVFSVATALDNAYRLLNTDLDYYDFLAVSIASNVAGPLNVLLNYYTTFSGSLINTASTQTDPTTPVEQLVLAQNFDITKLSAPFIASPPIPAITLSGATTHDQIDHVLTHNLFTGALQSFIDAITTIVSRTPDFLAETLADYPSHAPHYALYLTFLKLFNFAQKHLNRYTKKHLDFYYKKVLQLSNNPAQADDVHLIFQLQKNINQHLLSKGTAFKAGKDANNHDLFYALTDDIVLQTAQVQALKSIYLDKDNSLVTLYSSPVTNSQDGQGAKLLTADKSWSPFWNPLNTGIPPATVGFAIASNVLYLNEGTRTVGIELICDNLSGLTNNDFAGIFNIQLTGNKGWYTVSSYVPLIFGNILLLEFQLAGDAPPIVPYSTKIHGGNFTQQLPMVQLLLTNYTSYQKIKIPRITTVNIIVLASGVKNLNLQNDDGKINSAKPFKPFGDFPESGSSLILGSKEIFQKQLLFLEAVFEWQQAPQSGTTVNPRPLVKGSFAAVNSPIALGNAVNLGVSNVVQSPQDFTANTDYSVTSVDGYLKLEIGGYNYSLNTFLNNMPVSSVTSTPNSDGTTSYTVNKANIPADPTPVAKTLSVFYEAKDSITFSATDGASFDARSNFFYHIEPFGFREMHPFITDDALNLLPIFNLDDGNANDDGGELWIGLSNALPDETFSILYEVSDGSANPLKNMTEVDWYYLRNNNWIQFNNLWVSDQTNNLTTSGLVILSVPADATTNNTRADNNLLWVKAVVQHDPDAICNLIAVDTNAAKAQFVQDIPGDIEFTNVLAPNTISKPAIADAALKTTQQPYPSFGGRVKETDAQFYQRVSERLRHKHRAITGWDYERLTLQYFPQIFKVKCINHTGFLLDEHTNEQKYSETLAGHVMVVTIPDLTNLNTANILRPYTSIGLLTEIQQCLAKLTSPFVRLVVTNPQFEEVQFDFKVTFHKNLDETFYKNQLSDDIEQFLTPWAYGNPQAIQFGNSIEKSVVLNFVEQRSYVKHVTCFKMNQIILREGIVVKQALYDIDEAVSSTARSILVSYYNEITKVKHIINTPATCDCNG